MSNFLYAMLPRTTTKLIFQRNYYHTLEKIHQLSRTEGITCRAIREDIISVDKDEMFEVIERTISRTYNLGSSRPILIVVGFRIFDDHRIRHLVDLPVFFEANLMQTLINIKIRLKIACAIVRVYIHPVYLEYRERCRDSMPNLHLVDVETSFNDICNSVKSAMIEKAEIKYRLMDFRPKKDEITLLIEHKENLMKRYHFASVTIRNDLNSLILSLEIAHADADQIILEAEITLLQDLVNEIEIQYMELETEVQILR